MLELRMQRETKNSVLYIDDGVSGEIRDDKYNYRLEFVARKAGLVQSKCRLESNRQEITMMRYLRIVLSYE